jgi:hypothetical protein
MFSLNISIIIWHLLAGESHQIVKSLVTAVQMFEVEEYDG